MIRRVIVGNHQSARWSSLWCAHSRLTAIIAVGLVVALLSPALSPAVRAEEE